MYVCMHAVYRSRRSTFEKRESRKGYLTARTRGVLLYHVIRVIIICNICSAHRVWRMGIRRICLFGVREVSNNDIIFACLYLYMHARLIIIIAFWRVYEKMCIHIVYARKRYAILRCLTVPQRLPNHNE